MKTQRFDAMARGLALLFGVGVILTLGYSAIPEGWQGLAQGAGRLGDGWLPAGPWLAANALRSVGAILLCFLLLAASWVLGHACHLLSAGAMPRGHVTWTLPFAGYAVLSLGMYGIAAVGLCFPGVVVGTMACGVVASLRRIAALTRRAGVLARDLFADAPVVAFGLVFLGALGLSRLLLPEHNEDSLMYNLSLPQQLLIRHRLPQFPSRWGWAYPLLGDYPNLIAVSLGLDASVRLTGLALMWMGASACLGVFAGAMRGGWVALLALVALLVPADSWFLLTSKNDMASCGYVLAAMAVLVEAGGRRTRPPGLGLVAWGAFLFGCAIAVKYTLAPMAVVGLGLLVAWRGWCSPWRVGLPVTMLALPILPWLVVSWIHYADPLHPAGAQMFPGVFGIAGAGWLMPDLRTVSPEWSARLLPAARKVISTEVLGAYPALAAVPIWWLLREPVALWVGLTALLGPWLLLAGAPDLEKHMGRYAFPAMTLLNIMGVAGFVRAARQLVPGDVWWRLRGVSSAAAVAATALVVVLQCRLHPLITWKEAGVELRGRAYLMGRMDAEGYRRSLMGSFGVIQPKLAEAVSASRGGGRVLVTGGKFLWGIPAPLSTECNGGTSMIWAMAGASDGTCRMACRFRQAGVRWILYDSDIGAWDRTGMSPFRWTPRMLRVYADCAKSHFRLVASTVCEGPGFGQHWLYEVSARPHAALPRIAVLPGADAAFASATIADATGAHWRALAEYRALYALLPDVTGTRCALGHVLVQMGRFREGYAHVRASAEDGIATCTEPALLDWSVAAMMMGREQEALDVYRRALLVYTRWPTVLIPSLQSRL